MGGHFISAFLLDAGADQAIELVVENEGRSSHVQGPTGQFGGLLGFRQAGFGQAAFFQLALRGVEQAHVFEMSAQLLTHRFDQITIFDRKPVFANDLQQADGGFLNFQVKVQGFFFQVYFGNSRGYHLVIVGVAHLGLIEALQVISPALAGHLTQGIFRFLTVSIGLGE